MDYYEILGVPKDASEMDIRKAYKKLAIKWHPDKNQNKKEEAEAKFREISEAYHVLSNPDERKKYDMHNSQPDFQYFNNFNNMPDPQDIFKQFFGMSNMFDIHRDFMRMQRPVFNHFVDISNKENYTYDLPCSLEELYTGTTKNFKISRKIVRNGRLEPISDILNINIKPGWKEGTKITYDDITFIIKEEKHPIFRRNGDDLHYTCHISLKDAIIGFSKTIQSLDNSPINIKINSLNRSTDKYIVVGKGMPSKKDKNYGDLIVDFDIDLTKS